MSRESLEVKLKSPARTLLCLEVNPPRGTAVGQIFERLDGNLEGVDFFNVTDSALAKMKFSPLPFASILKQRYNIEPLVNIACRDRNIIALQSDLLAGWATGVRSIIALTGDALSIGDFPDGKGVFEINSVGLLHLIETLNSGKDLAGHKLNGAPDFCPGVVVNPNAKNVSAELRRLAKKKEAGAVYALSQPVFDEEGSYNFFKEARSIGMDIFIGLLPFRSGHSALGITQIPGIKMPGNILEMAKEAGDRDLSDFSLEHCIKLAKLNRENVRGFHVISGATPKLGVQLTRELAGIIAEEPGG